MSRIYNYVNTKCLRNLTLIALGSKTLWNLYTEKWTIVQIRNHDV